MNENRVFMPSEFFDNYIAELSVVLNMVSKQEFQDFIAELNGAYSRKSNIFICGNGGSAATASHFACDINKGVSFRKDKRFKIICLNDNIPTMLAYANDVSYDDIFVEQIKNYFNESDLFIGVSGSGNSENVLRAARYCNEHGGRTFGISGCGGGKLRGIAHKSFVVCSNDMQKVEDVHLIIFHCAMQYLIGNTK